MNDMNEYKTYRKNGKLRCKCYVEIDHDHPERMINLSVIDKSYQNGQSQKFTQGVLHNDTGPAVIVYYATGEIKSELYKIYNVTHRDNGPAYIEYYKSGIVKGEYWMNNHAYHRDNAPAIIKYTKTGDIRKTHYCYNGEEVTNTLKSAHYFESSDEMKYMIWEMLK